MLIEVVAEDISFMPPGPKIVQINHHAVEDKLTIIVKGSSGSLYEFTLTGPGVYHDPFSHMQYDRLPRVS